MIYDEELDGVEDCDIEDWQFDGECVGCDIWGKVDETGLCADCAPKLERDLIRQRAWAHSATAFGCPPEKYEELRQVVVAQYGEGLELLAPDPEQAPRGKPKRNRKRKRKRKQRG